MSEDLLMKNELLDDEIRFKYINFIIVALHEKPIDTEELFNSIKVYKPSNIKNKLTNSESRMPYFGKEDTIVSAIYNDEYKGVRESKRPLKNIVSVDYQIDECNKHIKICKSNTHLTGSRDRDKAIKSIQSLINHINENCERYVDDKIVISEYNVKTVFYYFKLQSKIDMDRFMSLNFDDPCIRYCNATHNKMFYYDIDVDGNKFQFRIFEAGSINGSSSMGDEVIFKCVNELYKKLKICLVVKKKRNTNPKPF